MFREPTEMKDKKPVTWIPMYLSSKQKDKSFEYESKKLKNILDNIFNSIKLKEEEKNQLHNLLIFYDLNKRSNRFGCKWKKKIYLSDSWDGSGYIPRNGEKIITNTFTFDPPPSRDYHYDYYKKFGEYIQWTPLQHYLNVKNSPKCLIELLLSYGARVDIPDITGKIFQLPEIDMKVNFVPSKFFHSKIISKVMNDITFIYK